MIKNKTRLYQAILAAAVAMALSACGGGGGDDSSTADAGDDSSNAPADLQTLVPSNYPANSPGEYMFNQLNAARTQCGFGALRHDVRLDSSAQNHAAYQARNGVFTHDEDSADPGFTGTNSRQRMMFTGYHSISEAEYPGSTIRLYLNGEGITSGISERITLYKSHIPLQLSLAYHSIGALRGYRDVGFGIARRSGFGTGTGTFLVHNVGSESASQKIAGGVVATYPCDGMTNIRTFHGNETPNPLGTRNLTTNPPGHPVVILSRWGTRLTEIAVVMQNATTDANVAMAAVRTMDNDASGLMNRNEAFAIPDQQLEKNTTYRVQVTGKVDGKTFENHFAFTTGTLDKAAEQAGRDE